MKENELPAYMYHPGYHARNQDVANAYGLNAGLKAIFDRMRLRKDCPIWLLEKLDSLIQHSNCLIQPLVDHRDEIKQSCIQVDKTVKEV